MMTVRRLLSAMALMPLLAACAGGDAGGGGGGDTPKGSGTVAVAAVWTGGEQASFQAVLDKFTEESGIKTRYTSTGDDVGAFLGTQIQGGSPPGVAILPQPGLLRDLAKRKSLKPLSADVTKNLDEHYAPIWKELASVDGTPYGVYVKAANKSTWWYNKKVFEAAGVQPPKTWDEMLKTADTVVNSGTPFVSIGGADGWTLTDWFENIYLRTAGPEMYDKLADHQVKWTDPSVVKALQTFAQLLAKPGAVAGDRTGALRVDFPTSVTQTFADPPKAATVFEGDFVAGVITGDAGKKAGEDFDFFEFPQIGDSPTSVVGGGDVAVALTDDPNAQKLLAFLATPEAAEVWAKRGGFTSPNKDVDASAYPDDITRRSAEAVTKASDAGAFRFDLSDLQPTEFGGTPGRTMWKRLQDFLANPTSAQATATQLERDAAAAYAKK